MFRRCRRNNLCNYASARNGFLLFVLIVCGLKYSGVDLFEQTGQKAYGRSHYSSRQLLSVEWEQCDFEIGHSRNYSNPSSWYAPSRAKLWVLLYVVLILVIFVALAIICDDFFVPSLEAISEKLNLSEDVAGATFMAAGSSAPELFTSIAGVTVESDVGVGTIVGSAVFNLLGICALSAAFAGQVLQLDWRPLCRDATYYCLSICAFIVFAWDGKFELYESCIILSLYFIYILIMKFNPQLMEFLGRCSKKKKAKVTPEENYHKQDDITQQKDTPIDGIAIDDDDDDDDEDKEQPEQPRKFSHINKGLLVKELTNYGHSDDHQTKTDVSNSNHPENKYQQQNDKTNEEEEVEDDDEPASIIVCPCLPPVQADIPSIHDNGCFSILRFILSWILFLISFPFVILFTWTIPNCSTTETKKYYLFSFIMSIAWIAALSFGMVTLAGRAGCILGVDKFTMGLVVIAIGTSIPDALSSVLVARDGFGDMAVSNAIGSNVFDIDLGIGLPFVISSLIRDFKPVLLLSAEDQALLDSGAITIIPHVKFGFILLIILALSLMVFAVNKFRLTKFLGAALVFLYLCFVAYAYVQDLHCNHNC